MIMRIDSPYSSCQVGAEQPTVCRLIRQTAHPAEAKVDGSWSGAGKVVEDRGFRGFEAGQSQDRLDPCAILFATAGLLHDLWPPIGTG